MYYEKKDSTSPFSNFLSKIMGSDSYSQLYKLYEQIMSPGIQETARQFDEELAWQKENYASQLDFANRQLNENTRIAQQNFDLQNSAFEYQKQLNNTQMLREDTALQRQMADAQAAGLSPFSVMNGSGASSSPLSVGNTPQYDMSGINQASGNYIDFAKQYAQLHMQAYATNTSNRINQRLQRQSLQQGARIAIKQMQNSLDISNNQLKLQYQQLDENKRQFDLNYGLSSQDYELRKRESDWMQKHGYRNQDIQAYLVGMIASFIDQHNPKELIDKFNEFKDGLSQSVKDKLDSFKQDIQEIKDGKVYTPDVKKVLDNEIPKEAKEIVSKEYTGKNYDDLSKYEQEEVDNLTKLSLSIPF